MRLEGKVALITGGGAGIGRACAELFAQESACAVNAAMAAFGKIDVLYNNVGGSTSRDGPVTTAPFEEFWRKMKVDLFGTWLGCHYLIPHMIAAGAPWLSTAA